MPVLTWIGKDKVVNHDKELPFRVLKPNKKLSVGENSENLLIEGDNLEALKALMPFYYGKINCIYIDPPYNTGHEGWVYNDRVNSPQIKSWLNKTVGAEGEDLCRHDKWLCMMYPRLKLLYDLLSDDGAIFISIDDNEAHNLRGVMNEIFGEQNFLTQITWQRKKETSNDANGFSIKGEYILAYRKSEKFLVKRKVLSDEYIRTAYKFEENGRKWRPVPITVDAGHQGGGYDYAIKTPIGTSITRKWRLPEDSFNKLLANNLIYFGKSKGGIPQRKQFLDESVGVSPSNIWFDIATNKDGKKEILDIFGSELFQTPKPSKLLKEIFSISSDKDSIILDSFAGTGTTGQAVLELNKEDGGKRKFIIIELERDISKKVTSKRIKKVIEGYDRARFPKGTGGDFQYLDLNGELYDYSGYINPNAQYEDLAAYVYFTETKNYLDLSKIDKPHIGSQGSTHYFLFFEGKGKNVLDEKTLKNTDGYKGNKVIYADKCLLDDDFLEKYGIVFKQIPYELKKY